MRITPSLSIDEDELTERFVRASGPGGQNVNKVATAVELRFDAAASPSLPDRIKARLRRLAGRRMTEAGVIVIQVDDTRSQSRNRTLARDRLRELLREAAAPPPPPRIGTKPTHGSVKRRLEGKARRSVVKKMRRADRPDD